MFLKQSLKQFLVILACCSVSIITYFVSTVIVHAQVANDELKDSDSDDKNEALAIYFTSSYLTFPLFVAFLVLFVVKDLNPNMKIFFVIFLSILDGALTVTTAGGVSMAQYLIVYRGAGISMFVGAALFLLVKFFPILPMMFQYVTTGLKFTPYIECLLKKYLPIVISVGLAVGFIFSLMYAGAAIALVAVLYSTDPDDDSLDSIYNSLISSEIFMLSLPALVYFLMIAAMISYVLFKWKWCIRSFSVLAFFLLALLGYSLNDYIAQLYSLDNISQILTLPDEVEALHRANISLTTASFGLVLTTICLNICWPILYNVQHQNEGHDAVEEGFEKYEGEEHM